MKDRLSIPVAIATGIVPALGARRAPAPALTIVADPVLTAVQNQAYSFIAQVQNAVGEAELTIIDAAPGLSVTPLGGNLFEIEGPFTSYGSFAMALSATDEAEGVAVLPFIVAVTLHPSSLFALSQPGIWLDGSDNSVMFQDNLGLTPVTGLGQQVGLILDKRLWQGRTLAQEIAARTELRGDGVTGVVGTSGAATYNTATGEAVTPRGSSVGNRSYVHWTGLQGLSHYRCDIQNTGSASVLVRNSIGGTNILTIAGGERAVFFLPTGSTGAIALSSGTNDATATFIVHSIKLILGRHAFQESSPSRPLWEEDALGALGLRFDGSNDFLATQLVDFSVTDKMSVGAGARKLSDADTGVICKLVPFNNTGTFTMNWPRTSAEARPVFAARGEGQGRAAPGTSVSAPLSWVLTGLADLAAPFTTIRENGVEINTSTLSLGGVWRNEALIIGASSTDATFPFNGFVHQLVVRGGALPDATELAQLENFAALKSKVAA